MDQPEPEDDNCSPEEALIDPLALGAAIHAAGDLPDPLERNGNWIHKSDSKLAIK